MQNRGAYFRLEPGHPNELGAGKRPLHTLSPGMLLRDGKPEFVYGTMGGDGQPQTHVQLIHGIYEREMSVQAAIDAPRFVYGAIASRPTRTACASSRAWTRTSSASLRARGHTVDVLGAYDATLGHAHGITIDRRTRQLFGRFGSASRLARTRTVSDPRAWGATDAERAANYPCDDLGFAFDEAYFRAVEVRAPVELTFRWLCQLRVAPYSYDWLDNFGRRSPPQLTPGLERLAPGQRAMIIFRIVSFVTNESLTVRLASALGRYAMGDFAGSYAVTPVPGGCRLVAKVLVRYPGGTYGRSLRWVMPHADLFMFRKQLNTLRAYAERDA